VRVKLTARCIDERGLTAHATRKVRVRPPRHP
jgi:hypothetical protein